jgi:hypothetical protein
MITHNWMATRNHLFLDFAINKKCKDHSKILQRQTKERISEDMWMEMAARGPQADELKPLGVNKTGSAVRYA